MTNDEGIPNDEIRNSDEGESVLFRRSGFVIRRFPSVSALTTLAAFGSIEGVKWLALFMLLALECSCTTIANRRDLYSPQPAPDLDWHRQAATTTTTRMEEAVPVPANR